MHKKEEREREGEEENGKHIEGNTLQGGKKQRGRENLRRAEAEQKGGKHLLGDVRKKTKNEWYYLTASQKEAESEPKRESQILSGNASLVLFCIALVGIEL